MQTDRPPARRSGRVTVSHTNGSQLPAWVSRTMTAAEIRNELLLIASLIRRPDRVRDVRVRVRVDDFGWDAFRRLYQVLLVLDSRGEPIDLVSVDQQLVYRGEQKDVGAELLADVSAEMRDTNDPDVYADRVISQSLHRDLG